MYYIINKIESVQGSVKYTPIGYTLSKQDCDSINQKYEETLGTFFRGNSQGLTNNNIPISVFFNQTNIVYSVYQHTTNIEGMGLLEITNIQNMI